MENILAIFILTLTVANYASAQCSDADKKALEAFDKTWGESSERGDRAALQNIYADDYQTIYPGGQIGKATRIDTIIKDAEAGKSNPPKVIYDNYNITCTPTTAVITHRNTVTENAGGKEQTFYSRSVHILEKRGGRWQVVADASHPLEDSGLLLYMETEGENAYLKHDWNWFEKNTANDFVMTDSTGRTLNKAENFAQWKNDKNAYDMSELLDLRVQSITGDTAIVTGIIHVKGRNEKNQPFDERTRFTDTLVKRDGKWQFLASQEIRLP